MTKKEQALGLFALIQDTERTAADRLFAVNALMDLKKAAKVSWDKLGVDEIKLAGFSQEVNLLALKEKPDPLDEAIMPEQKAKKPTAKADTERGLITALTKKLLLEDDAPYADIVEAIKVKFPNANTTTRSVASVASDMRKKGEKVASRRKTMNDLDKESL